MVFLHVVHNLLERLLLFDVHAIADVLFVLPIVNHIDDLRRKGDCSSCVLAIVLDVLGRCWCTRVNEVRYRADLTAVDDICGA